jgi:protocatechuate 3,4-dioxygenase beta subunit
MTVGADGRFRFRTIRPAPYSGRTPHVHVKVLLGGRERLTTQLYVRGEPRNERDGIWRRLSAAEREAVSWSFTPGADGLQAEGRLVIEA